MAPRSATNVDSHVGRRIRDRRVTLDMSQVQLAKKVGVSFQQVQKDENFEIRISASRLLAVAAAHMVPVSYFFVGIEQDPLSEDASRNELLVDGDGAELLRAFNAIEDQAMRRAIINAAKAASRVLGMEKQS
jgi:transcriptional regulator with XRE-family HTH domain